MKEGRANFQTRRANSSELRAKYLYSLFLDFKLGGGGWQNVRRYFRLLRCFPKQNKKKVIGRVRVVCGLETV